MKTVLFLCSGNYYRSRFAEIFFNWHAARQSLPWTAQSRGLALDPGNMGPMSVHTLARLEVLRIPIQVYWRPPQAATEDDFRSAQHVVAVKRTEHHPLIQQVFPRWLDRVEFWEVHDLDCAGPETAIPHLEREVQGLIHRMTSVADRD